MQKPKSKPPQPQKYDTAENEEMILSALPFSESLPTGFAFSLATNAPLAMHMTEPLALILPPGTKIQKHQGHKTLGVTDFIGGA